MRLDLPARHVDPREVERIALSAEESGFDGLHVSENQHDPFIAATIAARATSRIRISTAIAVAFARNPMTIATTANDIHTIAEGRFVLGLGSQVKAHVERRFSMPWSAPAPRMEEFVHAVRAIWAAWENGSPLAFEGAHYRHTLMTDFFDPGPNPFGSPPVWLAALGEGMTRVAGRVADGFFAHPFMTADYIRAVTLPALVEGRGRSDLGVPVDIAVQPFVSITDGADDGEKARAVKRTIAFYASTPAYRPVLEFHGWGGYAEAFTAASRRQEWETMDSLVNDEMLHTFAVVGTPQEAAAELRRRFSDFVTTLSFTTPAALTDEEWGSLRDALQADASAERA